MHLLDACNDVETDILKVSTIVARDVTITAKILRLANSAFLGSRSKIIDIEQAIIYLGVDTVRNLAISVAVHETFKDHRSPGPALEEFWHHSLLTALLAKGIAELNGYPNPTETYLAGFLHDIGKYLLSLRFGQQYVTLHNDCEDGLELLHQEREELGITHAEAGARLIEHWNLEPSLAQAIANHHLPLDDLSDDQPVARITALAHTLAEGHYDLQEAIEPAARQLQLSLEGLAAFRIEQLKAVELVAESLGIPATPAPPKKRPTSSKDNSPVGDQLREKVHFLAQVSGLLDNLTRAKTLNRTFLVLEESLQVLFDIDKSILLLPDEENFRLTVHGSFRNRSARSLKGLQVVIAESALLGQAVPKRTVTYFKKRDAGAASGAEKQIFDVLATESLLAVPFAIGDSQRGILLVASAEETEDSNGTAVTLLHLSSHIGSRLLLENIKNRQAETLAEERVAAVDGIARSLAHEIANPLSIISNYVALLGSGESCSREMREDLAIISNELERIGRISGQLNELSTPPQPLDLVPIDIPVLIAEILQLFEQSARLVKNASVAYLGDLNLPKIRTKPDSLRQILLNLLSNSLDAVGQNGWIRVESHFHPAKSSENQLSAGFVTITVADSGPGLDPAIANRVFSAGLSTKGEGHIGLGLAIVKKLVTDLKGKVRHGTGTHGETEFIIDLPTAPAR